MRGIVDHLEGEIVVIEVDGQTQDFNRSIFSEEVEVGDVVEINDNTGVVLKEETKKRRAEVQKLMDELFE
ncbi:DUF3006 domain-containing protein [Priestia koreensis]|uniref:DUF3006 domain-containing protein n=1 Tax=Priestia koreensis TaxID=284581 RepID=UPI00203B7802|nr:DUF3006 domain-containing protein [Priestia koreensis]MCM3006870.1 DUF3006 domain-containing protein [Priestia koreensis]